MIRNLIRYVTHLSSFMGLLVALAVPIVAICLLPIAYTVFQHGVAIEFLTRPCAIAVIAVSTLMGCVRGWIFHPVFDKDYWDWLARTPWRLGYPLPYGSLDLKWQDLIAMTVLVIINGLLALTISPPAFFLILGPTAGYCLGVTVVWSLASSITGHGKYVLLTLAVPLLFQFAGLPVQAFVACPVVMMLISRIGLRRSLADFPWPKIQQHHRAKYDSRMIGWPWKALAGSVLSFPLHLHNALPLSIVIGGWFWFISTGADSDTVQGSASDLHVLIAFAALYAAGARVAMFRSVICDRLCTGLRFGRKKWIVPKHDQIFIAPLTMLLLAFFLPLVLPAFFAMPPAVSNGLSAGLVSLIGLAMGPKVHALYHTGEHSKFGGSISASDKSKSFVTAGGN